MSKDFKFTGMDLFKKQLATELNSQLELLGETTVNISFNFDFKPLQKKLFYVVFSYIEDFSDYEYKQDSQGIKIQVRADDRHNFLLITENGELAWIIYDEESYWCNQFRSWDYTEEKFKNELEQFIKEFIN